PPKHLPRPRFAGGLASEKLVRMELTGTAVTKQEIVLKDTGRIRDIRSFDGFLYLVYDEPGKVVRLVPAE
ncbi:MAG: PQQ-dependent sugar dehydrogenase, partial [Chthoniobacterales bacterium]